MKAAMKALETGDLNHALIWVPPGAEDELRGVFERTLHARAAGPDARDVADDWFFETAIRLHRAGEGAAYTGMKPAGLSEGPVVPRAERAIETGDPSETIDFLLGVVEDDLRRRFGSVMETREYDPDDVDAGREFIGAFIGWVVYAHHLFEYIQAGGEEHGGSRAHGP